MSEQQPLNAPYLEYENLLIRLNELAAAGSDEAEAAEDLRARMDGPWKMLSDLERSRLTGLSADLFMLQDEEVFERGEESARQPDTLGIELARAESRQDWDSVLALLRRGPAFYSNEHIAFVRAMAYRKLGLYKAATAFLRHAAGMNPTLLLGGASL